MNAIKILNEETLIPWVVRMVEMGEKYGLDDCLTHNEEDALVEFYDARYPHDKLGKDLSGQFVSRYYVSTLLEEPDKYEDGLQLDGGTPEWQVSQKNMDEVIGCIRGYKIEGDMR